MSTFSTNRLTFVSHVAGGTGLDPGVCLAWTVCEFGPSFVNETNQGNQNWMAIGGPGAAAGQGNTIWQDPAKAGDATAGWIKGTFTDPGFGVASASIQAIVKSAGQSPQTQIAAINDSGWVSGTPGPGGGYGAALPAAYNSYSSQAPGAAATPGGTAGLGGTGTAANKSPSSTYTFQVGSTDNPDEDYWTAANRLAQEVNWYLFSDAETVYYIDGSDLIAQAPGANAVIDRIANADRINHISFTWDNPLAVTTPVLTTGGWKTMGTLEAGDHVYAEDGSPTRVLGVSEVFPDKDCYELGFADGGSIVASGDHHWKVKSAFTHGSGWRRLQTDEIAQNWRCRTTNRNRYRVACDAVVECPEAELPIDPYIFGLWLGDGSKTGATFGVGRMDRAHLLEEAGRAGYRIAREQEITSAWGHGSAITLTDDRPIGQRIYSQLKHVGVYDNKHIPDLYLSASVEQRRALLAGLLDSDGTIAGEQMQIKYTSTIERLARDAHQLARSLGARAVVKGYPAKDRGTYIQKPYWSVTWTPTFDAFRLPRKSRRFRERDDATRSMRTVRDLGSMSITSVRRVPTVPTCCIAVEHDSHVYLAGRTFVPLFNTAFQYVSTHKRKARVQHKTSLAKVMSPTECQLNLICGIDEFRAGDIIVLSSCGPGDGRWIIGDARRSVFSVYTELTLVPPIAPLSEQAAAGTTGVSGASNLPGTSSPGGGAKSAGGQPLSGTLRQKVVEVAQNAIARQASQHAYQYAEVRPYPSSLFGPAPVITDCSGFSILCYKDAGAPDPNGTNYNGEGYTGSLVARGTSVSTPQPGDLVFYSPPGVGTLGHVAVYLGNGQIANMGGQGEPVAETVNIYPIAAIRSYL